MIGVTAISGGGFKSYYEQDDYYFKAGQHVKIHGDGKKEFGFKDGNQSGNVARLEAMAGERKTKAFDLTMSAPKSVSVAFGCGDNELKKNIQNAMEKANKNTLKYVENNGYFRVQKTENGITKHYAAKGMVAAAIPHSVSRNLDPQLHIHNLIPNAGYIEGENKVRALHSPSLYKAQLHLDQIFKSELRSELEKAGIETRSTEIKTEKGVEQSFELKAIDRDQIEAFSTRKNDIDAALEEQGLTRNNSSRLDRQNSSTNTRVAKKEEVSDVLFQQWKEQGKELGINLTEALGKKNKTTQKDADRYTKQAAQELFGTEVTFTRQQVTHKALELAAIDNKPITASQVASATPKALSSQEMIRLPGQKRADNQYTDERLVSKKLLRAEAENQRYLVDGKDQRSGLDQQQAEARIDKAAQRIFPFKFQGEQRDAAVGILTSKDLLTGVQGDPGTGKTTMLQAVAEVHGRQNMVGLSVSGAAAKKLCDETGMTGNTVAKFLIDYDTRQQALKTGNRTALNRTSYMEKIEAGNGLIVVDEASMLGSVDANRLCQIAHRENAKVVLVGDRYQLPGVAAGKPFEKWQDEGLQTHELKEIRRQRNENDLAAVKAITEKHDAKEAVEILKGGNQVKQVEDNQQRLETIVDKYFQTVEAGKSSPLLITGTNKDKDELNTQIRQRLGIAGTGEEFKTVNSRGREVGREMAEGDRIVFMKNDNKGHCQATDGQKILNGSQGVIQQIEGTRFIVNLVDDEGRETGQSANFDIEAYKTIDHSYALTTYKSQGQSVERDVIYHADSESPLLSKNEFLVGISRNKNNVEIYTDNTEAMAEKADQWVQKDDALQSFEKGIETETGINDYINKAQLIMAEQLQRQEAILETRNHLKAEYGGTTQAPKAEKQAFNEMQNQARSDLRKDLAELETLKPDFPDRTDKEVIEALGRWDQAQAESAALDKGNAARSMNASDKKLMTDLYNALPESDQKQLSWQAEAASNELTQIQSTEIDFKDVQQHEAFRTQLIEATRIQEQQLEREHQHEQNLQRLSECYASESQREASDNRREVLLDHAQDDRHRDHGLQQVATAAGDLGTRDQGRGEEEGRGTTGTVRSIGPDGQQRSTEEDRGDGERREDRRIESQWPSQDVEEKEAFRSIEKAGKQQQQARDENEKDDVTEKEKEKPP